MNMAETIRLLSMIKSAFPGRFEIPDVKTEQGREEFTPMATLWMRMLRDLSFDEAAEALEYLLTTAKHPPSIGDIREAVAERRVDAPDIAAAWEEVRRAIGRVGYTGTPEWSSPVIAAAVEAVGWKEICMSSLADEGTLRAQFREFLLARARTQSRRENYGRLQAAPMPHALVETLAKRLTGKTP